MGQGFCWKILEWSYLAVLSDGSVVIQGGPTASLWFNLVGSNYVPAFNAKQSLAHDTTGRVFRLYDLDGTITEFDDFNGAFLRQRDPAGNVIQVTALSGNGSNPARVERSYSDPAGVTTVERFSYTYETSTGDYLLTNVLLERQVNGGSWASVAQASYTYYANGESNGAYEDLKTATTQIFSNDAWATTGTTYYRYWKQLPSSSSSSRSSQSSGASGSDGSLSVHLLKYVLQPTMYDQMIADGFNPATATDSQLSLYADFYFEYDQQRRCTKETVKAGSQTFTFSYSASNNSQGFNSWATKTIETLPDGNQNVIYANYAGQTMLAVFQSGSDRWSSYYRYDANGYLVLQTNPSGVSGFDETKADLVNFQGATAQYLKNSTGLFRKFTYHAPTGWASAEMLQEGQLGLPIIIREYEYVSCTPEPSSSSSSLSSRSSSSRSSSSSGPTAAPASYFLSRVIVYPEDGSEESSSSSSRSSGDVTANGNTRQIITSFSYTFYPATCAVQQKTTTWPVIPMSQNGSGVEAQKREYFDTYGNLIWSMDERGFITGLSYDVPTGALIQRIDDVNTSLVTAPPGWTTPSGGGLHLITDLQSDGQGRTTQVLGPMHTIDLDGAATAIRRATWNVYKDSLFQSWTGQGYQKVTGGASFLINPISITILRKDGKLTDQIQAIRFASASSSSSSRSSSSSASQEGGTASAPLTTAGAMTYLDSFSQSSYIRWATLQYTDCCLLASLRIYKLIPSVGIGVSGTNFDETDFGYDVMKRQTRVVTSGGTIFRSVFDARGLTTQSWVGTDDTGATSTNPAGSGPPNNMVQVAGTIYDGGLVGGDGIVTQQTMFVDASGTNDRVTAFLYDFRNRRTDIDGEINVYAKTYYDNLNRIIRNDSYDTTSTGRLIGRRVMNWDDRGRVFQAIRYAVDPSTGSVGNSLTDNIWFDASGNTIKVRPAGSQRATKIVYDSLGRATTLYAGYNYTDTTYATALSVSGDTVLEQAETTFDAASNVIQSTSRQRYHNATGTGPLGSPTGTQPLARVSYLATYPDALGRFAASANCGTNAGVALNRSATIPARSDTWLVTSVLFNARGEMYQATDPTGTVRFCVFDDAGRPVTMIQNYRLTGSSSSSSSSGGCVPSDDTNNRTTITYTPDGLPASMSAFNVATGNQTTTWSYGTTLSDSAVACSMMRRFETMPNSIGGSDRKEYSYNRQFQTTTLKDPNGTVHSYTFDLLGRIIDDGITTLGSGVDNAVLRIAVAYEVRGLVQNFTSYNNATVGSGSIVNDVQRAYNAFGQLTREYQAHSGAVNVSTTPHVQYSYADGSANTIRPTSMTYPNGRVLNLNYGLASGIDDALSRIESLIDNDGVTHLADYSYLGLGGIVQTSEPEPGIKFTLIGTQGGNDPTTGDIYRGIDLFGRIKDLTWAPFSSSSSSSSGASSSIVRILHGYDRAGNRLYRRDVVAELASAGLDELYEYDLLNRLKEMDRGTLNGPDTGIMNKTFAQCWTLDSTGNWKGFREDNTGSGAWSLIQSRSANPINEITALLNSVGPSWVTPTYNAAGNMITIPQPANPGSGYSATYDAWNRLVTLVDSTNGNTVQTNAYDGRNYRVVRNSFTAGVNSEVRHFYYTSNWQSIEERLDNSTSAERQSVFGLRYIDDIILRFRDATGSGTLSERLYAMQDPNWNVVAVASSNGIVQERYSYSPYGVPTYLTSAFGTKARSSLAWDVLYCAYRCDTETGLYSVRQRAFHPLLGTWVARDPIGIAAGIHLYEYCSAGPVTDGDPFGLTSVTAIIFLLLLGILVGLVTTLLILALAPVVAGWLAVLFGTVVANTIVSLVLLFAGGYGLWLTILNTRHAIAVGNWGQVAFNIGTIIGGFWGGASGYGRYLVHEMTGAPSPAPNTWNLWKILRWEWDKKYDITGEWWPWDPRYWNTSPTPTSATVTATGMCGLGHSQDQ